MNNSYKGKLLISTPDIQGDIFSRAVVLILEHNEEGAFGLVLNKKNQELSRKLRQNFKFETDIYEGGPVEIHKYFFIVKGKPIVENYIEIEGDYYATEDLETLGQYIIDQTLPIEDIKVFSGYSGWAPSQLESEIQKKYWNVVEVFNLDYTSKNDEDLWKKIMQNLGGEYLIWANAPKDISMN